MAPLPGNRNHRGPHNESFERRRRIPEDRERRQEARDVERMHHAQADFDYEDRGPLDARPTGHRRSDARIREDVNDVLADDPYLDASGIEVKVASCEVTLHGTVDTRASKRRAESLVDTVSGVTHVQNNLRIEDETAAQESG